MTSDEEKPHVIRVAEAISDGLLVDWDAERPAENDQSLFSHLRAIESIATVHRAEESGEKAKDDAQAPDVAEGTSVVATPGGDHETWGTLVLRERIGGGGFGDIFRAFDPALQRDVALKLFRAGALGSAAHRYLDEARRLARVRHPNVIVVHGADERDGRVGLWTELLRGHTLAEWIAQHGPLSASEAATIGMELCRALAAVHAAGLVHRDVKVENIMREEGGRLVLLDFGAVDTPSPEPLARVELGTPLTMAPEQLRGGPVGPAADIYGLGVALYRLVTTRYPIEAETLSELIERHSTRAIVPLRDRRPDLPGEFVRVVEKSLDPLPERRYASIGEMERALAAVVGASPGHSVEARPRAKSSPWWTGKAVLAAILGMLMAFLVVRSGFWNRQRGAATPGGVSGEPGQIAKSPDAAHSTPEAAKPTSGSPTGLPVTANATLYLDRPSGPVPLQPGDRVTPGDAVFLRIGSSDAMYVYVLDEDERGALYALYPVVGVKPENPLPGNVEHRLPGSLGGKPFDWQVTSAGGSENVCVIASRTPIKSVESELARFPHAHPGVPISYGRLSSHAADLLRGLGGMTGAIQDAGPTQSQRLGDLIRSLRSGPRRTDEPWIWTLSLQNPGDNR